MIDLKTTITLTPNGTEWSAPKDALTKMRKEARRYAEKERRQNMSPDVPEDDGYTLPDSPACLSEGMGRVYDKDGTPKGKGPADENDEGDGDE